MKRHFLILLFLILILGALVGLNAISYTKTEQIPDSEAHPNRSSYNSGATGTSAFYSLLAETGNKVVRWQQPPAALLAAPAGKITTLVLIGQPRRFVTEQDSEKILQWVAKGGRLVLIDRFPDRSLMKTKGGWRISAVSLSAPFSGPVPSEAGPLTDKVNAAKPVQPTLMMKGITAVQPSVLASSIKLGYSDKPDIEEDGIFNLGSGDAPPPPPSTPAPKTSKLIEQPSIEKAASPKSAAVPSPRAPVVQLSNAEKDILVDYPYENGHVVFLSDPFIVSNAGIKLVDNGTLAVNMATAENGTIAFDEFHQGFGSENTFFGYFAGTPVIALLGQALLLIFVLVWTRGRRFARPLPAPVKDRRSKLEYVAAMADLQRSTRAFDLAIENVYTQTKRDIIKLVGADNTISKKQLAEAVAQRAGIEAKDLYKLMSRCEDIIHGERTNAKETMNLISELRILEEKLGLNRSRGAGGK
jgi:hypothetical protein